MSAVPLSAALAAEVIERTDWSGSPLGPRDQWSVALRQTLAIVLACPRPMALAWGPQAVLLYNDACSRALGPLHPPAMGRRARDVWPETWPDVEPAWRTVMSGASVQDAGRSITLHERRGPRSFDYACSPLPDGDGQVGGVLVTFEDTTEKASLTARLESKAELLQRLRAESVGRQQQLQAVLDSVNTAVITVNRQFEIVLFNRAAEHMFEVHAAQMLGRSVDALLPERFRPGHGALMESFAQDESQPLAHGVERELMGRRWSGVEFPVEAAVARVPVGGDLLMTIVLRDLTEVHELRAERQARAAAEAASQAKSQFLSHLSHELRTPLNAVIGFAQLLELDHGQVDAATVHRYAGLILQAGRHQLAMVEDLLDLGRIEEQQLSLDLRRVPLSSVVQRSLDMVSARAQAQGIRLDASEVIASDATAHADEGRVRQVLVNLLSNAIKYNRPGGQVTVRHGSAGGQVCLGVTDTGIGIPEVLQSRLFTPFDRLGQQKGAIEGAGMGLALARRLARIMGGDISVESVEGQGSTFTLTLPADEASA